MRLVNVLKYELTTAETWVPAKLQPALELYIAIKGNMYKGTKKPIREKFRGNFRRPPLAEFGADAARSFADHTAGEGGAWA